jgi:hypothetical protein
MMLRRPQKPLPSARRHRLYSACSDDTGQERKFWDAKAD